MLLENKDLVLWKFGNRTVNRVGGRQQFGAAVSGQPRRL